ncbi:MAG: Gfo/Idh/MocA family oxidoreductase, partial [bacterium]|nr:Gfo/Idh/MocA family oxidoreductase [bacterium]
FRSSEVKTLATRPNIFSVLQLKYHPMVKELKEKLDPLKNHEVEMDISVYRDPPYYAGWKGTLTRSGGILFNLGIHYFDLLVHLFGTPTSVGDINYTPKTASGSFAGKNFTCNWRVSTDERRDNQRRVFKIDGVAYNFSSKDNLAYENLHRDVYRDLLEGKGITPAEALPAIELIENLYKKAEVPFV